MGALAETPLRDEDGTETARPHTGHGATRRQGAMRTPHPRPKATGELTQLSASSTSKSKHEFGVALVWARFLFSKGPKMRVKGAEMRGLIPFGAELANKLFEAHPSAHTRGHQHVHGLALGLVRPAGGLRVARRGSR